MKKILNWFKKRTASKILIVLFAALTIGFLIAGQWGPALIEFAFFLSWVALDLKSNAIEVQGNTIKMLMRDNKQLKEKLDLNGATLLRVTAICMKYMAIADLCQHKIDLSTYIKNRQEADEALEGANIVINVVQYTEFQDDKN